MYFAICCAWYVVNSQVFFLVSRQAVLLLDAFNKDRASLQQPVPAQQPAAALPPPDPRTQEMINEKLKKAEELGKGQTSNSHLFCYMW